MQMTLPKGWKKIKLSDISSKEKFSIRMGPFGSQLKKHELVNEGVKVLWIENIVNNEFEWKNNKCITLEKFNQLKGFQVRPNDILTSTMGTIGKSCVVPDNIGTAIISSHLLKISVDSNKTNPKFISQYIKSPFASNYFNASSHGVVMKGLNTNIIKNLPLLLPPLKTQNTLVEILEEADNLRKLRRQADEKMKDLIPSLFVEMFGDPATNPKGWEVKKLGEVANIRRGASPRPMGDPKYFGGAIPWVRIADIHRNGKFLKGTDDHVTDEGAKKSVYLKAGSLIMAMAASIGTPCFLAVDGCIHDGFVVFEKLSPKLDKEFLYYFIVAFKSQFTHLAPEGTQKNLNTGIIKSVKIPLPPLQLQKEFAKLVEDIEAEKARQADSGKKLDDLFNSLMQRAFKGELVA